MLYQLSKNLNRPFFMDFLTHLSVLHANGSTCHDEDSDEEAQLMDQMKEIIKPSKNVVKIDKSKEISHLFREMLAC